MIGKTLDQYEIREKLGEGGMGEVWKAVDTTLDREVAIKVLPEFFAADPERLARFEREAKVLASLNHSGIAVIHGLHETPAEDDAGKTVRFLAMEYVPGEDLAERLQRGPLSLNEALFVGAQIAEALEAAHAQGVIHRDLKPGNIVLTPDGKAKVLDFGLAKSVEADGKSTSGSPTFTATVTSAGTKGGVILGTAAYMSPEQARGKPVDRRTDIWAFGCVLYECLTAHGVYRGETVSDSLGAILHKEPDWERLPAETPPNVRLLLRRCMTKNASKRLHDIADARIELESAIEDPTGASLGLSLAAHGETSESSPVALKKRRWWVTAATVAGITVGLVAGFALREDAPPGPVRKLDLGVTVEAAGTTDPPAISPDGTRVAFVQRGRLWLQALDELDPRMIVETDDAIYPFWSPDSTEIAYFSEGKLWKVDAGGGRPVAICELGSQVSGGRGAGWGEDGRIVFSLGSTGLFEVSALGGKPAELLAPEEDDSDFHEPSVLPGNKGVLFVNHPNSGPPADIQIFTNGERRPLLSTGSGRVWSPVYAASGHILFRRDGNDITDGLWAVPFSLGDLNVTGDPFLVFPDASAGTASSDGTLAFVHRPPSAVHETIAWFDRNGRRQEIIGGEHPGVGLPTLSPDGQQVAFVISNDEGNGTDIWVRDLERGTEIRLTRDEGFEFFLTWNRDGRQIYYTRYLEGDGVGHHRVPADASSPPTKIGPGALVGLSPDGTRALGYWNKDGDPAATNRTSVTDIFLITLDGSEEPRRLIVTPARDVGGWVSPDGRYFAYQSERSGQFEVYLTRFPDADGRWLISVDGGRGPVRWSRDGDRLYYVSGSSLMEVSFSSGPEPRLGRPVPVLEDLPTLRRSYSLSGDGEGFFVVVPGEDETDSTQQFRSGIKLVQNWHREFEETP